MKALILAAGRGSRMEEMTDDAPKCLVRLQGKPLLEWQLAALKAAGIEDIGIVTGYRRELLSSYGLQEFHNPRWAETNMVTSLECAQEWLTSEPCIVSYSDIFYEPAAVKLLVESTATMAITYDPNWLSLWTARFGDPLLDAETFRIKESNTLVEIGRKPRSVQDIQGQYMGLLKFTPQSWIEIQNIRAELNPAQRDRMHCTGTLQAMVERGNVPVQALRYEGKWGEVDTQSDLAVFQRTLIGSI
ncbi:MAG: phosphocholine cytidylyltransferase family protein [Castellaniella sp.]|uniref:phosphocholine cytidylyltransferase family protein n=1 Tax=Castellaniella sp. TaxID=1955812 RepID=UPI003C719C08